MSSKDGIVPSEDRHCPDWPLMFSSQQFPGHEDAINGIQQASQAEQTPQSYSAAAFYTKEPPTAPTGRDIQRRYTRETVEMAIIQRLMDSGRRFTKREADRVVDLAMEKLETQGRQSSNADDARITRTHTDRSDERHASQTSTVESERYTLTDAENRRDPREFATTILRSTRLVALENVEDKLKIVFDAIAPIFWTDLTRPGPESTVEGFLQELDGYRAKWFSRLYQTGLRKLLLGPPRRSALVVGGYYFATHQPETDSTFGYRGRMDANNLMVRRERR